MNNLYLTIRYLVFQGLPLPSSILKASVGHPDRRERTEKQDELPCAPHPLKSCLIK